MTAPSSYILTSCQPFRPDNSPAISRRTLLTKQQNWKLSAEVSITTRSTTNWLCHWKAQLNTRSQTTELSTNQAEDQVPSLLYSSTFTSSPVISVHYKRVKLAKTSAQASGTTTTTSVPMTLSVLLLLPLALQAPAILGLRQTLLSQCST